MIRNPYAEACQQRCVYANALVEAVCNEKHAPVLKVAMLQGVVYQLHCAHEQHLREIAENYSCPEPWAVNSIQDVVERCHEQGVTSPEVAEILHLLEDETSWLARCLGAYEAFQAGDQARSAKVSHGGGGRIALYQESEYSHGVDTKKVEAWLGAMTELMERHRSLMCEY